MLYISSIVSIVEVLIVVVPSLLVVAFITIAERKTMASMQRRLGPNAVGWYGLLQAFADALKLLLKEYVSPTQANIVLFFLGPIITLIFSLLGYAIIPYSPGLAVLDFNLSILYALAVSSLATYGILLAGWSANSKYAFLGSLRSTAQLISYELILSSAILLVVLLVGSLNIGVIVEAQRYIWFIIPLFPIFIIFFIGAVAETNRAPFDLAEAESELVSGFMTEHSAVIFVFFFLAEYASIVLICITTCILFLGGYLLPLNVSDNLVSILRSFYDLLNYFYFSNSNYLPDGDPNSTESHLNYVSLYISYYTNYYQNITNYPLIEGLINAFVLGGKSSIMIFIFIWVRASFPRIRFDELMSYCWTILLPILIAFIIIVPFNIYSFCIIPSNITLLGFGFFWKINSIFKKIYSTYKLVLLTAFFILLFRIHLTGLLYLLGIKIDGLLFTNLSDINSLINTLLFSIFSIVVAKLISAFTNCYYKYKLGGIGLNITGEIKKKFTVESVLYIFFFLLFSISLNYFGFVDSVFSFIVGSEICNVSSKDKINEIITDFRDLFKRDPHLPYNFPKRDVLLRYSIETQTWAIDRINGGKWNNEVALPQYHRQHLLNMHGIEYEFLFTLVRLELSRPRLSNTNRYELETLHGVLVNLLQPRAAAGNPS